MGATRKMLVGILALIAAVGLMVNISVNIQKSNQLKGMDTAIVSAHHARDAAKASATKNEAWLQRQGSTIQTGAVKGAAQVAADIEAAAIKAAAIKKAAEDRAAAIKKAAADKAAAIKKAAADKAAAIIRAHESKLNRAIVATGRVDGNRAVTKADCTANSGTTSDGSGTYSCYLTINGGGTGTWTIVVRNGAFSSWKPQG